MRVSRFFLAIILILASSLDLSSRQTASTVQRDSQAVSILTQSLTTMGAIASPALATLAQGTVTYPDGTQNPVTIRTLGVDYIRNDVGQGTFSFVSAAGSGFLLLNGKRSALKPWVTQYKRAEHIPSLTLMGEIQNPDLQARYLGSEDVNGLPAHHIRLSVLATDGTPSDVQDLISEFHVWIDQASLLVVRTRGFNFSPEVIQNRSPVDTYYSDYRQQDGALVPFHLTRFLENQKDSEIAFSSISLTASVNISDFE